MEARSSYNIPIAKPYFTGEEPALIAQALESGWVSQGPLVEKFENTVAKYAGAKFAVATTSCTTALHLSMLIHGIGAGDEVICPSYSFVATANGVRHAGAEPQFVDIDANTLNICPVATEEFIAANYTSDMVNKKTGKKLKGILIVHQIGIPADIDAFKKITESRGLTLLEDSACALGSFYKNQPIGSSGFTNSLSFHPRKVISCGEGGMILTGSEKVAETAKILRAHGASISDYARHKSGSTAYESYDVVGYNYRMTDIQAALGVKQMDIIEKLIARRLEIGDRFNKAFSQIEGLEIITPPSYVTRWNYQSYPIRLAKGTTEDRNKVMAYMQEQGIATRRGIPPIHKEPVYRSGATLPNTESVSERSLFLPIFMTLTDDEVEHIIKSVKAAMGRAVAVSR